MATRSLRTRAFQAWFRMRRPMTLGVRALITDSETRVFLIRHTYVPGWHLPGGGVEKHETCETALEREVEEEAGLTLSARPRLIGVFSNQHSFPNDHVLLYHVTAFEAGTPDSAGEIAERGWFSADALPDETTPATHARISEWRSGSPPPRFWTLDPERCAKITPAGHR